MKKLLVVLIALPALFASSASGSVTIGQLAPGNPPDTNCSGPRDLVMPTVSSGNSYVVHGNGVITSWSHNAAAPDGQTLGFKVFRHLGGAEFTAVAHNGPRALAPGTLNTFPVTIPIKSGDIIGLNSGNNASATRACEFDGPDRYFQYFGDLPDGQPAAFDLSSPFYRLNISAVFEPSNTFTLGQVNRNRKKGTATVTLDVPNAGEVTVAGKGVKGASAGARSAKAVAAGEVSLKIKAKGNQLRKLNSTGKVTVKPTITYTPTGGATSSQKLKLKLRKS